MPRYLNEIRLGKEKDTLKEIIRDVRQTFGLDSSRRPVPHVTLFGPYDTTKGLEVKKRTQSVLSNYDVVRFSISGFGQFSESNVVYFEVEPSVELREMRRELARTLFPLSTGYPEWDTKDQYQFHVTVETNLGHKCDSVYEYVRSEYDVEMELYAKRVTALDKRNMMWEWDLPRGVELSSEAATSRKSWRRTDIELARKAEGFEHGHQLGYLETLRDAMKRALPWYR